MTSLMAGLSGRKKAGAFREWQSFPDDSEPQGFASERKSRIDRTLSLIAGQSLPLRARIEAIRYRTKDEDRRSSREELTSPEQPGQLLEVVESRKADADRAEAELLQAMPSAVSRPRAVGALSEDTWQAPLCSQVSLPICEISPDGFVSAGNDTYKAVFSAFEHSCLEFIHERADRQEWRSRMRRLTPASRAATREHTMRMSSGELRLFKWFDTGRFDESGRLVQIISVGLDVTTERTSFGKTRSAEVAPLPEHIETKTFEPLKFPVSLAGDDPAARSTERYKLLLADRLFKRFGGSSVPPQLVPWLGKLGQWLLAKGSGADAKGEHTFPSAQLGAVLRALLPPDTFSVSTLSAPPQLAQTIVVPGDGLVSAVAFCELASLYFPDHRLVLQPWLVNKEVGFDLAVADVVAERGPTALSEEHYAVLDRLAKTIPSSSFALGRDVEFGDTIRFTLPSEEKAAPEVRKESKMPGQSGPQRTAPADHALARYVAGMWDLYRRRSWRELLAKASRLRQLTEGRYPGIATIAFALRRAAELECEENAENCLEELIIAAKDMHP